MGDYFKPLRRKIGMMTLLMASLFAMGWVRSFSTMDVYTYSQKTVFLSSQGRVGAHTPVIVKVTNPNGNKISSSELMRLWSVPYWSIVIPLTLISAGLLFSKQNRNPACQSKGLKVPAE